MKLSALLSFAVILFTQFVTAQQMFPYERDIANKENYILKEISFKAAEKKDSITIYGTLAMPKSGFEKLVIIVPGSGADTQFSHYKLTDKLLQNNIAVYRYDDRGTGKSGGKNNSANYTIDQMSAELYSAFKVLLKTAELKGKKIGMLGHSQGGMVTMGAYKLGAKPDFLIQWATPVQKHGAFLTYQLAKRPERFTDVFKYETLEEKLIVMESLHKVAEENPELDSWPLSKKLDKVSKKIGYDEKRYTRFPYMTLTSEKAVVQKNLEPLYKNVNFPLLYIVGSADDFVDATAETSLLKNFTNPNITVKVYDKLNHYLGNTLLTSESMYNINETPATELADWIKSI